MMTMSNVNGGGNGGNGAISGRSLINKSLSKARRAVLGADILDGERDLRPTAKLVAQAVGCSVGYLHAAHRLTPVERQNVRAGFRPLIKPKVKSPPVPASDEVSDEELMSVIHRAGVGRAWDVIAKLIV